MSEDLSDAPFDGAPEENSVSEAADAIAELLKKKPEGEDDGEEGAPPAPLPEAAPEQAADPQLAAMKAEAQRAAQESEQARQQFTAALHHMAPQLEQQIRGEFADIKTPADMVRLAQENPARYNRLVAAQEQFARVTNARAQVLQEEQQNAQARAVAWQQHQHQKLGELVPEMADPQKKHQLADQIGAFAGKMGYTYEQMLQASATDIALLHRAMQYDGLGAARDVARAKAARAPRVFEPGARGESPNRLQSDFERLRKSGSTSDAAAVFDNFLK